MNETNNIFSLKFMEECSFEEERAKYLNILENIRQQRERNITVNIPYKQIPSPENAYIHPTDELVNPIYTKSNGYGKVHIWIEDGVYNAGVEIENRYITLEDELLPKIKVYDVIPDSTKKNIEDLINEKNNI